MTYKWSCWRCEKGQKTEYSPLDRAQCKRCSGSIPAVNSNTNTALTALKVVVLFVCVFILFLNCVSFIASIAHRDPMINEECNSRVPNVMFMYHFGCYITGNTYYN